MHENYRLRDQYTSPQRLCIHKCHFMAGLGLQRIDLLRAKHYSRTLNPSGCENRGVTGASSPKRTNGPIPRSCPERISIRDLGK